MFPWEHNVGWLQDVRPANLIDSQSSVKPNNDQELVGSGLHLGRALMTWKCLLDMTQLIHQNYSDDEDPWVMAVAVDDESDLFVGSDIADAIVSAASHIVDGEHIELIRHLVVVKIESAVENAHMMRVVDNAGAYVYPYSVRRSHGMLEYLDTSFGWKERVGWCQPEVLHTGNYFEIVFVVRSFLNYGAEAVVLCLIAFVCFVSLT